MTEEPTRDFFISYTSVDRPWAEWIAVELEQAGYTTIIQSFDFRPGTDFAHQMQRATATAGRTIAVLSPAYFGSRFGEAEWRAAFAKDPSGEHRLLIPVRVQPCKPVGMLATRVYVDLVGATETVARRKLRSAINPGPRPTTAAFPGQHQPGAGNDEDRPPFPGPAAEAHDEATQRERDDERTARSSGVQPIAPIQERNSVFQNRHAVAGSRIYHLSDQHRQLLQSVSDLFRRNDCWPTLNQIYRPLRQRGIDAVAAIQTMPAGLLVRRSGSADPVRHDEVPLTLRGMSLCDGTETAVDLFLKVTRWAAAVDTEFDPGDDPHAVARLISQDVASQFNIDDAPSSQLRRLYAMLLVQRWGFGSGGGQPDDWWWEIDQEIHRFADVTTAQEYDKVRADWIAEAVPARDVGTGTEVDTKADSSGSYPSIVRQPDPDLLIQDQGPTEVPTAKRVSAEQQNAVRSARNYLAAGAFSRKGLIEQLSSDAGDGYSLEASTYAVDLLDINYDEQAAKSAKNYLRFSGFSRKALIEQLEADAGDRFTHSQAVYGVNEAGL